MKGSPRVPIRNAMNIPWVVFALAVGLVAAGAEGKKAKSVNIPSTYSVQVSYKMPYIGLEVRPKPSNASRVYLCGHELGVFPAF